jgi:hypothetical protein
MPEPREARRGAQFPGFCLLHTRHSECATKILCCFFRMRRERLECDFPGKAINFGLASFFLRPFYFLYRVVNATLSIASSMQRRASSGWPSSA